MARHTERRRPESGGRARWLRWFAAAALTSAGATLLVFATAWRGVEAVLSARAIQLITGQATQAVPARHMLILYKDTSVQSIFVLTSECSVAYLLAALLIGAAPLMLLKQLSPRRTGAAVVMIGISVPSRRTIKN